MPFQKAILRRNLFPPSSLEWHLAQQNVVRFFKLLYMRGHLHDVQDVTSTLTPLNMSWSDDIVPLCSKSGILNMQHLLVLSKTLDTKPLNFPSITEIQSDGYIVEKKGASSISAWQSYYIEKLTALREFVNHAIDLDSPIRCDF